MIDYVLETIKKDTIITELDKVEYNTVTFKVGGFANHLQLGYLKIIRIYKTQYNKSKGGPYIVTIDGNDKQYEFTPETLYKHLDLFLENTREEE